MLLSQQYLREDLSRKKSLSYIKVLYKIKNSIHINSFMLLDSFSNLLDLSCFLIYSIKMIHFISLEIEQLESKRKKKEPKKSLQIMYCKGYEYLSH